MVEWKTVISNLLEDSDVAKNYKTVQALRKSSSVLPEHKDMFRAFNLCPTSILKVVILGQDPYPQFGVADGLAFSTKQARTPNSLETIFQEIKSSGAGDTFETNDLSWWAKQGVLLLNTSLSVQQGQPNSHAKYWIKFIANVIRYIAKSDKRIVWMLWGKEAITLGKRLTYSNPDQLKLEACHPAAQDYNTGEFIGCNHFIKANEFLRITGQRYIDWNTYKEEPYPPTWNQN